MNDNSTILVVGLACATAFGVVALAEGQTELAALALGGIVGAIGGHLNGTAAKAAP